MRASLLHLTCAVALLMPLQAGAQFTEGFDDVTDLPGWVLTNNSRPAAPFGWDQGFLFFDAFVGAPNSYIASDFNAVLFPEEFDPDFTGTLSNWLLTPVVTLSNGATFSFFTRASGVDQSVLPDRLELRLSTESESADVGDDASSFGVFTRQLLTINNDLGDDYPIEWTEFSVSLSGLTEPTSGRFAFWHHVTNVENNGYYIGIDEVTYAIPLPMTVPEPGSLLLLGAGMLGFAVHRRRKA